jgi:hypothetical protein
LCGEFVSEVSAAFDRIAELPESRPHWARAPAARRMIRKATIHRFPYVIAFETATFDGPVSEDYDAESAPHP